MYPKLIINPRTPISVVIKSADMGADGSRAAIMSGSFLCSWQDKGTVIIKSDRQAVQLAGTALIDGDICPQSDVISCGTVTVHGITHDIEHGYKIRNPDGTVNYTRLDVV